MKITTGMRIEAKRIGCKPSELGGGNLADAKRIDRAITSAVRKERERCVGAVDAEAVAAITEKRFASPDNIIDAIRKGKASNGN